jgi:hypothetical protein
LFAPRRGCRSYDLRGQAVDSRSNGERPTVQVSRETFEELVEQALGEIPTAFAPYLRDVVVDVEDQPTPAPSPRWA